MVTVVRVTECLPVLPRLLLPLAAEENLCGSVAHVTDN